MPGPRPRERAREAKQALYRQLVLDAAQRVFAEKGYDDAKMEEIAAESGLSLGTLYSVFDGKAAVFRSIHEAGDAALLEAGMAAVHTGDGPLEALLAGVRAYLGYFMEHPDFLRMHLAEGITWGAGDAGAWGRQRTEAWSRGVEMLATAFRGCMDAGLFEERDPRLSARMMIAMQQVQLAHWVEGGMTRDPAEVADAMAEQVRRFFARAGAGG